MATPLNRVLKEMRSDKRVRKIRAFVGRKPRYSTVLLVQIYTREEGGPWKKGEVVEQHYRRGRPWWTAFSSRGGLLQKSKLTVKDAIRGDIPNDPKSKVVPTIKKSDIEKELDSIGGSVKRLRSLMKAADAP